MNALRLAIVAALGMASVAPAWAESRPSLHPARDVAVTYRIENGTRSGGSGRAAEIRMTWADRGAKLRVDLPNAAGYALVDFAASRMHLVMTKERIVLDTGFDPSRLPGFAIPENTHMTRAGSETVAGNTCMVWQLQSSDGTGTVCITDDGLLLRGEGQGNKGPTGSIEAVSVTWGPPSPGLFVPPSDYRRLQQAPPGK